MSEQLEFQDWTGEGEEVVPESSSEEAVETPPQTRNYEVYKCKNCEDTGACARCARGLQWIKDNPIKL